MASPDRAPQPQCDNAHELDITLVWAVPRSLALLRESHLISFPRGTEIFHFPRFAPFGDWFQQPARFPHSGIPGSKPVCGSPRLIAAYHALHRLLPPRHPPHTLNTLTSLLPMQFSMTLPLVETRGFEPLASCLQSRRSPG